MDDRFLKARHYARIAKRNILTSYARDPNVVGGGFGRRIANGEATDTPALVIYVARKIPPEFVPLSSLLPRRVYSGGEYIDVDVFETGPFYVQSFTARERPAPSGISLGHFNITAGTLGCLVIDNTDQSLGILSNNHVMADGNQASLGDAILQPGPYDGGTVPADTIATLKRFVTINPAGNVVDTALAQVTNKADVVNQMKNNLMPVPRPGHPAVGLLFAGSCNRTIMNPIDEVLGQLDVRFVEGGEGDTVAPDIGMHVEKVGRTTEYTTSDITEIDVTVTVSGYPFGSASFDHQIATAWLSDGGDSGSIVCEGGKGGNEDHCGCGSTNAAASILGQDLGLESAVEKEFRQRYLSQTRIGRFAVDVYFHNEQRIIERVRSSKVSDSDRAFIRYLYGKYIDQVRTVLLQPNRSEDRLTEENMKEAREFLGRVMPFMSKDEATAAERLFEIAQQAVGRTPREILKMLDDEALYKQVVEIVSQVSTLAMPDFRRSEKASNYGED